MTWVYSDYLGTYAYDADVCESCEEDMGIIKFIPVGSNPRLCAAHRMAHRKRSKSPGQKMMNRRDAWEDALRRERGGEA